MKLSHIEVTVPIGRTERGQTLTVMDLLRAFSVVTGTEIGSQEFDRALGDPSQLHAKEIIENSLRYRTLKALALGALTNGARDFPCEEPVAVTRISAESRQTSATSRAIDITISLVAGLDDGDLALDRALDAYNVQ